MNISDYNNVDISKITYSSPEKYKGSYICTSKYNDDFLYIQTPMMSNLDGIHKTDTRAHIDLYFEKDHLPFYNFLGDMDDNNIQIIHTNSPNWFNKPIDMDILEDLYTTPLKHKNPPKFKLKLPLSRGNIDVPIIDIENKTVEPSDIPNNCKVVVLMKYIGLKFLKEQVICEWIPVQLKVCQSVESKKQSLIDDTLLEPNSNSNIEEDEIDLEIQELPDDFPGLSAIELESEPQPEPETQQETQPEPQEPEPQESEPQESEPQELIKEDETIKKSVEDELNELKKKYFEKDSELTKLKEVLRNFISN